MLKVCLVDDCRICVWQMNVLLDAAAAAAAAVGWLAEACFCTCSQSEGCCPLAMSVCGWICMCLCDIYIGFN
uniref:Secreted protein n=1 Tax=Syphacia muris TaxID=451379 RepID=A0A0N5AL80_9BILA